ncbi:MAG: hypothetical protein OXC40_06530, partial [Proteobacteria bacterium]|nr:hypothetical protein [Pseudomonadota bacterium]
AKLVSYQRICALVMVRNLLFSQRICELFFFRRISERQEILILFFHCFMQFWLELGGKLFRPVFYLKNNISRVFFKLADQSVSVVFFYAVYEQSLKHSCLGGSYGKIRSLLFGWNFQ